MDPRPALGIRARELGHDLQVVHEGKRFKLRCSCGFSTTLGMRRKTAFEAGTQHLLEVVHHGQAEARRAI